MAKTAIHAILRPQADGTAYHKSYISEKPTKDSTYFSFFWRVWVSEKKEYILSHELVPKHEIMTDEEVQALLKKYGMNRDQLPKILQTDPVVEAIGAKKGQILRIKRNSLTAGQTDYYRIVV